MNEKNLRNKFISITSQNDMVKKQFHPDFKKNRRDENNFSFTVNIQINFQIWVEIIISMQYYY